MFGSGAEWHDQEQALGLNDDRIVSVEEDDEDDEQY